MNQARFTERWIALAMIGIVIGVPGLLLLAKGSVGPRWRATYFSDWQFRGEPMTRLEDGVGSEAMPPPSAGSTQVAARWESEFLVPSADSLYLMLVSVGPSRLFIDKELVLLNPSPEGDRVAGVSRQIEPGWHGIRVEYRGTAGTLKADLLVSLDGGPPRPIPASRLREPGLR
ncbi:MAG: hypothetical protein FD129_1435 [bacterium]|nr:MAG: hypothetical protein FD129_1435 [bacterium]